MSANYSNFEVPSFARREAYVFDTPESYDIYRELTAISEEIAQCRATYS